MLIRKIVQRMLLLLLAVGFLGTAMAQVRTVTGQVTDPEGRPIPAATVRHVDGNASTVTNEQGNFSIDVPINAILEVTFVGYSSANVNTGTEPTVLVVLMPGSSELGEVIVTALGIKRDRKALGYAVQEIKGQDIVEAREPNVANALTGKVAGLQVVRSSTGPAGSSKIVLRGFNSLTGNNQPLIVVDGIPIDNFAGASNNDFWNPSLDMGNGIGDINSEDIESLTVLKGGAAAALYGSRAGNGVIMITTKSGRKTPGLGITLSSSFGFERPFLTPDIQTTFGQGSDGAYNQESGLSWGPAITGQSVTGWDGQARNLTYHDNYKNYFEEPGFSSNQNLSFQQQFGGTAIYASYNRIDDKSFIPNVKLIRNNLTARQTTKFGNNNNWEIDTKIQYGRNDAYNRPVGGFVNVGNQMYSIFTLPNGIDIREFSDPINDRGGMKWFHSGLASNPYWTSQYNLNNDTRDRYMMTGSIKHHFTDWMTLELKAGSDRYVTNANNRTYLGGPMPSVYGESKTTFYEDNYTALLTGRKDDLGGSKWGTNYSLGGNLMKTQYSYLGSGSGELEVPNLFSLNNGVNNPSVSQGFSQKRINSVFGSLGFNYDGFWFIDVTARNDWSSALSQENRSYFYPSLSTSLILTDMFKSIGNGLPAFISYAKIRASYADVGNDMAPYQLLNSFFIGNDVWGNTTASRNSTFFDPNVRSELIRNLEAGAELRVWRNRIGVDFTWYKSNATRQLLNLPMDPQSGYTARKINAGDIQNTGLEVVVDANVLLGESTGGFRWDTRFNFSRNRNTIEELYEGVTSYPLGTYDNLRIASVVGGPYGQLIGSTFLRVEDERSPHYGQMILDGEGLPLFQQNQVIGDQQADYLLGWTNTFSYKGFSLSMLIDGRFGGEIYSATNRMLQNLGKAAVTVNNGGREEMVLEGVTRDAAGNLSPNTNSVTTQQYWTAITARSGNLGINEYNVYDATNMRIRTLQIGYEIPKRWVEGSFIQRARASVSMNNVLMLRNHLNGVDPESVYATGTNAIGFESSSPPTMRMVLVNLTVGF